MFEQILRIVLRATRSIARSIAHLGRIVADWADTRLAALAPGDPPIAHDDWYGAEVDGTLQVGAQFGFQVVAGEDGRVQFGSPRDLAADSAGNVYVTDAVHHCLHKLDARFDPIAEWGRVSLQGVPEAGTGAGEFDNPCGVAIDESGIGVVHVVDTGNDRVQSFDLAGNFLQMVGTTGTGPDQFDRPWGVAVDGEGRVFVTDHDNDVVKTFTSAFAPDGQWGGAGVDQLLHPRGIAIGPDDLVYVVDAGHHRVQRFTKGGVPAGAFGAHGVNDGEFDDPTDIAIDWQGHAYVIDHGNLRIQKFAATTGAFLGRWGEYGDADGEFVAPHGIAIDRVGDIFVVDAAPNARRMQRMSIGVLGNDIGPDGDQLSAILDTGPGTGTLALNPDGSFTYSPPPLFVGDVAFTYLAVDSSGNSDDATVTVGVAPAP